ncbi:MAG: hypothetical protein EXX96DRAFT_86315 [Benjaminiella poitrasii]|nr:MAG: hypothetical protein EXX96DRAFT_86315 [Benjaminiella poitrasii]
MSNQDTENASNFPRLGKTSPILSYFCVYNPSLGHSEENTKDQILYYTAKKVIPADVKIKQVGLAQALVSFTSTFSPSQPTQNVHSQKNRMVFLQPEPGFWMHMCIELGILRRQIKDSKGKEKLVTEYLDSQLNDKALEAVLKIGYEQFKLLNGTFSSIIEGPNPGQPTKQKTRLLMHAIEEFFSDWIWKWDFDRLDTMCFTAIFNGVPTQSVLRADYLRVHDLEESIKSEFEQHIHHVFVLNLEDGALVYRSPDLSIEDVCALRKYVLKRAENYDRTEKRKADLEITSKKDANNKMSGLKQFTKSLSQSHILSYFSSGGSKSTEIVPTSKPASITESIHSSSALPSTTDIPTEPPSPSESVAPEPNERKGIYLTGLIESVAIGMNGEERPVTKSDLVRVHISSSPPNDAASQQDKLLYEYYLLVYKHKSGLVWTFLLPATSSLETVLSNPTFYTNLENYMSKKNVEQLTDALMDDIANMKEKEYAKK